MRGYGATSLRKSCAERFNRHDDCVRVAFVSIARFLDAAEWGARIEELSSKDPIGTLLHHSSNIGQSVAQVAVLRAIEGVTIMPHSLKDHATVSQMLPRHFLQASFRCSCFLRIYCSHKRREVDLNGPFQYTSAGCSGTPQAR
ncbi:hypothetical protein MRX96_029585 [Rhipicephalus microplus]